MVKNNNTANGQRKQAAKGAKKRAKRANGGNEERLVRITAETTYGECKERLTAFGGLLALVKFLDLIGFKEAFAAHYVHPRREPKLGGYRMVLGILMLLFICFRTTGGIGTGSMSTTSACISQRDGNNRAALS